MDRVFRALANPTRRRLLDSLRTRNGETLGGLCADLDMTRQAVTQHLRSLEDANLVSTIRSGREKLHYLRFKRSMIAGSTNTNSINFNSSPISKK